MWDFRAWCEKKQRKMHKNMLEVIVHVAEFANWMLQNYFQECYKFFFVGNKSKRIKNTNTIQSKEYKKYSIFSKTRLEKNLHNQKVLEFEVSFFFFFCKANGDPWKQGSWTGKKYSYSSWGHSSLPQRNKQISLC